MVRPAEKCSMLTAQMMRRFRSTSLQHQITLNQNGAMITDLMIKETKLADLIMKEVKAADLISREAETINLTNIKIVMIDLANIKIEMIDLTNLERPEIDPAPMDITGDHRVQMITHSARVEMTGHMTLIGEETRVSLREPHHHPLEGELARGTNVAKMGSLWVMIGVKIRSLLIIVVGHGHLSVRLTNVRFGGLRIIVVGHIHLFRQVAGVKMGDLWIIIVDYDHLLIGIKVVVGHGHLLVGVAVMTCLEWSAVPLNETPPQSQSLMWRQGD